MGIRNRSGFSASNEGVSRRSLLKGAGLAAALVPMSGVLAACGSGSEAGGGGAASSGAAKAVPLPTYVPPVKPKPLLEGNAQGVMDVYASFPMDGPRTVNGQVGDGSDFNVLIMTYGQPSPPVSESLYWQLLNKELNLNVKPLQVPFDSFQTKFPALVAGDDLPEFVSVPMYMNVSRLPQLAEAQFTDLSEFLSETR